MLSFISTHNLPMISPRYLSYHIQILCVLLGGSSALAFSSKHVAKIPLFGVRGGGDDINELTPIRGGGDDTNTRSSKLQSLLDQASEFLIHKDADGAFATLAQAYGVDPTSTKVSAMFESCLGLKVELAEEGYYRWKNGLEEEAKQQTVIISEKELNGLFQDRMGLSSLYIDREHYDEAGRQLRLAIEEATFWLNYSLKQSISSSTTTDSQCEPPDFSSTQFEHWQPQIDRARYLLYRTNAACCQWESYFADGDKLRQSILQHPNEVRLLHPFDALKFPCIPLEMASDIAQSYAARALETVGVKIDEGTSTSYSTTNNRGTPPREVIIASRHDPEQQQQVERRIRIGYISPDFTSRHPLAFLMQNVFRYHDKSQFSVNIYSLASSTSAVDDGPEVQAIRESSDQFTHLSPSCMSPMDMYQRLLDDELDILVDLCGYAGTSVVSEIMASRCRLRQDDVNEGKMPRFPIHVNYMGFPGSVGSNHDYSVFDPIVIPPDEELGIRRHYNEAIVYMPHCYFVNSHKTVIGGKGDGIVLANEDERKSLRSKYGIHPSAFVFCCHSRPDKIDPSTFRAWMRALSRVMFEGASRQSSNSEAGGNSSRPVLPVLWLLRSGDEMEENIRQLVRREFGKEVEGCLVFANVAERREHLRRLGIADVFLDTPAYNAHTLGCGKFSL